MLQAILDVIFYIPRRIYGHFKYIKDLEEENKKLKDKVDNRDLLLKRIDYECRYYMKTNQVLSYEGFRKIRELAQTFKNDASSK